MVNIEWHEQRKNRLTYQLKLAVHNLELKTKERKFWDQGGVIESCELIYNLASELGEETGTYMALAVAYLQAHLYAGDRTSKKGFWAFVMKPLWRIRAYRARLRAGRMSDLYFEAKGYAKMNASELILRGVILRVNGRNEEADRCDEQEKRSSSE